MGKFKEMMKDSVFIRWSFFIVFNAVLLYLLYFIIKNLGNISSTIFGCLHLLADALWPLIIGLILAYLLNPLAELIDNKFVDKLVRKHAADPIKVEKRENLTHLISVILTYLIVIAVIIAIIYGFAVMIIGQVVFSSVSEMMQSLIAGITDYESTFRHWIASNVPAGMISDKLTEFANFLMNWLAENISVSSAIDFFAGIGGSVVNFVIGIIISIYLMKDKKFFIGLWRKFLHLTMPQKGHAVLAETLNEINGVFSKFIRGALLDAMIVAILSSIGLSVLGLEAAVFIGIFAGMANVIPYFGPVLGMIPAFLMGLCTNGFWQGALAVVILLVIQQIDSNLIYPKIVGTSTGLHPLMVLLSVTVFGYFWGILGMLLAVPIAGVIQIFVLKWANSREKKLMKRSSDQDDSQPAQEPEQMQ